MPGGVVILNRDEDDDKHKCVFRNECAKTMFDFTRVSKFTDGVSATSALQEVVDPFSAKVFEHSDAPKKKFSLIDISKIFDKMAANNEPEKTIECRMLTERRMQLKQKDIYFED